MHAAASLSPAATAQLSRRLRACVQPAAGLATRWRARTIAGSWISRLFSGASDSMEPRWWTQDTVAVVTGANKGIGFEIARLLHEAGLTVVLTSRNEALGRAAVEKLGGGSDQLQYHRLDIADGSSVASLAAWLQQRFGRVDILVNNASIAYKGNIFGADEAATTLATNFSGTRAVTEALLPLMQQGGRVVIVSSTSGLLRHIPSESLRSRFESPRSVQELQELADKFVSDIRAGVHQQQGWPSSMYGISKALQTSYARLLAGQLQGKGVVVAACHPGYCATDMSSWRGTSSAADGAGTPVWLALAPLEQVRSGGFYADRAERSHV